MDYKFWAGVSAVGSLALMGIIYNQGFIKGYNSNSIECVNIIVNENNFGELDFSVRIPKKGGTLEIISNPTVFFNHDHVDPNQISQPGITSVSDEEGALELMMRSTNGCNEFFRTVMPISDPKPRGQEVIYY